MKLPFEALALISPTTVPADWFSAIEREVELRSKAEEVPTNTEASKRDKYNPLIGKRIGFILRKGIMVRENQQLSLHYPNSTLVQEPNY